MYLQDSILKNVGGRFVELFGKNLFDTFLQAFVKVDTTVQASMLHLLQTWRDSRLFPPILLDRIEAQARQILARPVEPVRKGVHVNPDFVKKGAVNLVCMTA